MQKKKKCESRLMAKKNLKNRKQALKWNKHASENEVQSQSKINKWSKIKLYNEMNRRQQKPRKQS